MRDGVDELRWMRQRNVLHGGAAMITREQIKALRVVYEARGRKGIDLTSTETRELLEAAESALQAVAALQNIATAGRSNPYGAVANRALDAIHLDIADHDVVDEEFISTDPYVTELEAVREKAALLVDGLDNYDGRAFMHRDASLQERWKALRGLVRK